jgi:CysZ protein
LVYGSGLVLAVLTLVPVANLFAPIIGLVWMVHVYHGLPGAKESSGL